jgi:hypothetical protein
MIVLRVYSHLGCYLVTEGDYITAQTISINGGVYI